MPKPVLFGLRGLQNEGNVVAASRHLTPICRGKWRSLGEDIGTTDLLAHNQDVVGTFLRCKLSLKEVVGANGFEPSTSWSRTRCLNPINALFGVAYGTRSLISPLLVVPNLYLDLEWIAKSGCSVEAEFRRSFSQAYHVLSGAFVQRLSERPMWVATEMIAVRVADPPGT